MTDLSHIDHLSRVTGPTAHPGNDTDPQETTEWIDALAGVLASGGPQRARFLLDALQAHAARTGLGWKPALTTPYVNSIAVTAQPPFPGDLELERLFQCLPGPILTRDEVERLCEDPVPGAAQPNACAPALRALYRVGLLGYVQHDIVRGEWRQRFLRPGEATLEP